MAEISLTIKRVGPGDPISPPTLKVRDSQKLDALKRAIYQKTTIAPTKQSLSFNGNILQTGRSLAQLGLSDGSTIDLREYVDLPKYHFLLTMIRSHLHLAHNRGSGVHPNSLF